MFIHLPYASRCTSLAACACITCDDIFSRHGSMIFITGYKILKKAFLQQSLQSSDVIPQLEKTTSLNSAGSTSCTCSWMSSSDHGTRDLESTIVCRRTPAVACVLPGPGDGSSSYIYQCSSTPTRVRFLRKELDRCL